MVLASLFAALTSICSWISIPMPPVAFTMQTFGILLALGILGGKWGTVSIGLYLLLGLVGMPVFSGFQSGFAALAGPTGGFLWGFLVSGFVYWAAEGFGRLPAMIGAQAAAYLCGSWWFGIYSGGGIASGMAACVLPFLIPDGVKLALACSLSRRIGRQIWRKV